VLVICLGIAVLVVAIIALHEPNGHVSAQVGSSSVGKKTTTPAKPTSSARKPSRSSQPRNGDTKSSGAASGAVKDVPLIVLNNTTVTGLAKQAAERFEQGGWTVTRFANYQNDIASTCAYYDPAAAGAKAAAKALQRQYPTIKRIKERFAELPSGPVVVVLTPDYSEN
jgi:LytR cell envelope-related transcriptional attenuator